ncbi:LysR family transcriptional regulator [Streptomyces sp. LP05-1]|uniref:LysR family transcriptional regulator n=1 Tax=Streptomyces pyxinae TaxID=2970734 RepID=A0ABT2CBD9_9ACTN|nr:LysR family transcriptional regulator [Streptomyces sp. LP05-1]MCS0634686.1 LysR family transcriptional regulator [Streptomyces sp. LP05-1]
MESPVRLPPEPPSPAALDLNLLVALDALLEEESVTGAAARLRLSAPAVSRTLGRIRTVLGDPVLVRAGRGLVPTPYAVELRPRVRALVEQAVAVLAPQPAADPAELTRRFALQANDMVLASFAARLTAAVARQAPGVTLRFLPEAVEETPALRDGRLDLELGVIARSEPEILVEPLGGMRLLGVVRPGHPLLDAVGRGKRAGARAFAAADHIGVSRKGRVRGPVDERLAELGLRRRVVAVLPSYTAALFLCRETDLVCLAPAGTAGHGPAALGLRTFEVPLPLPSLEISMAWHPRDDADPGHRWLRDRVREAWQPEPDTAG